MKQLGPKVGRRLGGGLRSAGPGMAFVDVTGRVDADADGIVFEGTPLERPIIPRFIVPKNLARRLAKLTEGDAVEIENQRRAGNVNIEFDETKLRSLIGQVDGGPEELQDARTQRSRRSMRSIRERIPLGDVIDREVDKDEPDYEELDTYQRDQVWQDIRGKLKEKIMSMGNWTPDQIKRIEDQVHNLVSNLEQMRDRWELMGRRERRGLLRRERIVDGFESHPDIDLTIEDIVKQSEIRIHDDGTISLRLPPNKILRSLLPGDRDYHNTEIPDARTLRPIRDDIKKTTDARQWYDLVNSFFPDDGSASPSLARFPVVKSERLPFHDLFSVKYQEKLFRARPEREDAILLRANEIAAKILKHYVIPELDKIKRNQDARIGAKASNTENYTNGYLRLLTDPHSWQSISQELEEAGYLVDPLTMLHDVLGHHALGNTFDRHSEWGNILATLSLARDKEFWDRLRQIPGLEDLTDEDREIYLRGTLAVVAANWIALVVSPQLRSEFNLKTISNALLDYDGPIDDVIDRLDPPEKQGSMRSTRSMSLADTSDDDLSNIALGSVEGISIREERLSAPPEKRDRSLLGKRSQRTQRSLRSGNVGYAKKWEAQAKLELAMEKKLAKKRKERNRTLLDSVTRILSTDLMGAIHTASFEDEEYIASGGISAVQYRNNLLGRLAVDAETIDNPLSTNGRASLSEMEFRDLESLLVEYGQKIEPLSTEQQQLVIALRAAIKKLERPARRQRKGGNERSLPYERISVKEFFQGPYGKGWIYPDGTIYPVLFYHGDEHDYEESFEDGLIRLTVNHAGVSRIGRPNSSNPLYYEIPGDIGIEFNGQPSEDAIRTIETLSEVVEHAKMYFDRKDGKMASWMLERDDVWRMGIEEALQPRSSRSMRSSRLISEDKWVEENRRRVREVAAKAQKWKEDRKEKGLKKHASLVSLLNTIEEGLVDSQQEDEIISIDRVKSFIEATIIYDNPYAAVPKEIRTELLRLLSQYGKPSAKRDSLLDDLKSTIAGLDTSVRPRRGANKRPLSSKTLSVEEFAKGFHWGAWMYPDGSIYPVDRHELEFDYDDAFDDGMVRLMTGYGGDLTVDAAELSDEQLAAVKKLVKIWNASSIFTSREQLIKRNHGRFPEGTRAIGYIDIAADTPDSDIEKLLTTEDFSDTSDFLPTWMRGTSPATTTARSTRMVRPKTARKRDMDPDEPLSNKIWDTYEIRKTDDGVHYARNISYQHVRALRNGLIDPPMLPFFAPLGGGNNQRTGEGYYFSVTGRRFYGRYGASGALVRRKRKDGNYEYLLARRSPNMSVGAGRWSFPGGAHRDREDSELPGITAVDEFMQEVGGDIRANEPVYGFTDYMAPDWKYDTYVYEVGPKELKNLRPRDGENTNVAWFTADEILQMRDNDELLPSFARRAQQVITESGDTSVVSSRSVRSMRDDGSTPGEPSRVTSGRSIDDIDSELDTINRSMADLDARLESEEITLDEYRKQQIPLRKRSAELGRERATRRGRSPKQAEQQKRDTTPSGVARPQAATEARPQPAWDSNAFLEQQRQKQVDWMRSLGFSEDEINVLMSPTATSLRSRRTGGAAPGPVPSRFTITTSPVFSEVIEVSPSTIRNPRLEMFSDGELVDALEIYNIRIPENALTPDDSGNPIPDWFPQPDQIVLELQSRGYMATRLRMGDVRSNRYTDPMFFVSPNPDALPEQIKRRVPFSTAQLPEFIEMETQRTGKPITTRKGREFKDWKLISKLQSMDDDEFVKFGERLDIDESDMRRRKASGEIAAEEHDSWLNSHTATRNTYQDIVAERRLRSLVSSGQRLTIDNDPTLSPLDIAVYSRSLPSLRSQREPHPVIRQMMDDGVIDESIYDVLANYALDRQERDQALRSRLSDVLGFDVDGDLRPNLSGQEMDMVRGVIDEYNDIYGQRLMSSPLSELGYEQLSALGIDTTDAMILTGDTPLSMRSRRGKKRKAWNVTGDKKITGNMKKLTPEQVRAEQEQRRRAQTIQGKKKKGPDKNEWRQYSLMRSGRPSIPRARYLNDLTSNTVGFNQSIIGRPYSPASGNGASGFVSFGGDIGVGDVLPDNFLSALDFHGEQRYAVMGSSRSSRGTSSVLLRDLKTGSAINALLADDQQLLNVGRSESMRSSRAKLPATRAQLLDDFRNLRHGEIKKRVKRLLKDYASISAQLKQLDSQVNDEALLSDADERRGVFLDEMSLSLGDEIDEIERTINYLLAEHKQYQIDALVRSEALEQARNYTQSDLDKLNLTQDDWKEVMNILEGTPDENAILFDIPASGRAKTMSAITLATDLDKIIKDFERDSKTYTEFTGFEIDSIDSIDDLIDEDEKVVDAIGSEATKRVRNAYVSVQRKKELQSAKNTIINTTATEVGEGEALALVPTLRSARAGRSTGRSGFNAGAGLPKTMRLFPGQGGKFADSDVRFINIDGNRNEVIVGRKGGSVVRYGGLSQSEVNEFAFGRSSARQALNDIATNARYVIDSDGRKRGEVPTIDSLLKRDLKRVNLSESESGTVRGIIGAISNGADANRIDNITPEKLHGLVSRLFANGEPAMAMNILDAADAVSITTMYRRPIAPLSRKFGDMPTNTVSINVSSDESGIIRDELADLKKQFQANSDVFAGFDLYDGILESAQSGGMRVQFSVSPAQYEQIQQAFEYAYKQRGVRPMSGFTPLEHASSNEKLKFDTSDLGKLSGMNSESLFNNGAPMSMTSQNQSELIDWAKSSNIGIAKEIAQSPRLTLNEWSGLAALREMSPRTMRSGGGGGFSQLDSSAGVPLTAARPQNYSRLSPVEKLAWLNKNTASATNKNGVKRSDVNAEARNIFSLLETADANASQKQKLEALSYEAPGTGGAKPSFAKSWDSLSGSSRDVLNTQSRKLYDDEFLNLNPIQAVDVLRSVRPEASKRRTGPLDIEDSDINALWADSISASQEMMKLVSGGLRTGQIGEESMPAVDSPPRRVGPDTSSVDSSLEGLLARASSNTRVTAGSLREARTSASPDNPVAARQQRMNRARKIEQLVRSMENELQERYSLRNDDQRHGVIWSDITKLFESTSQGNEPDITIGKLNDALDLLDDYLASDVVADALAGRPEGFGPRASTRARQAVADNIGSATGLRSSLQRLRDSYANDPFIDRTPGRGAELTRIIEPQAAPPQRAARVSQNRIPDVEKYFAARRSEQSGPASLRSQKAGRAEIRAEATRFKELMDSLDVEAQKADDARTREALKMLKQIMRRQKSGLITDRRTNAGALFLTQDELDTIIEALYVAMDRQMARGGEARTALFAEMAELMAKAAMATFVNKTIQPINSRTMTKINEQGEEVEVALYE